MIGFFLANELKLISPGDFPYIKEAGVHNVIGGIIFGIGMVLAGGCASGTLFRVGEGNVSSVIALIGMLCGIGIFAEIYGYIFNIISISSLGEVTIYQVLGVSPWFLIAGVIVFSIFIVFFQN
jgi:hypothetical protein